MYLSEDVVRRQLGDLARSSATGSRLATDFYAPPDECDLSTQNAAHALHNDGLDPTRPALFILEGLTMYLSEDVVRVGGSAPALRLGPLAHHSDAAHPQYDVAVTSLASDGASSPARYVGRIG